MMKNLMLMLTLSLAVQYLHANNKPVKVTSVEGITEYKMDNGLKVLLFPDQSKQTIT